MLKLLPQLEAAIVAKTPDINEYVVDHLRDIGFC